MFKVIYSKAHETAREIGEFESLEDAVAAAYQAGAAYDDNKIEAFEQRATKRDVCLDVRGHEGDDDYAVWIERI